jgi:TolB protein
MSLPPTATRSLITLFLAALCAVAVLAPPADAAFPGRNGDIAYARYYKHGQEIFSANARTGKAVRLTSKAILDGQTMAAGHPSFGPDGKRIVFTNAVRTKATGGRRNDVYVMRSDGSHVKRLTTTERGESVPAFTADGTMVAYTLGNKTYLIKANGKGGRTELTASLPNGGIGATFSPDGTKVAVTSSEGGDSDIYVMNADGSGPVNVTATSSSDEYSPDFSPDGARLAFISDRDDAYGDLFTMAADGSDVRSVVANDGIETDGPAYSPDGEQIAVETRANSRGAVKVFTVDADGGALTELPHTGAVSLEPSWGARP